MKNIIRAVRKISFYKMRLVRDLTKNRRRALDLNNVHDQSVRSLLALVEHHQDEIERLKERLLTLEIQRGSDNDKP